ncbi:uncharacterized protein LOC113511460 [Galleria mellonella]|uniref:Uncharacterized protein LOC113511460 n=1 Tax=Galleria mellonella TaxID=7137 RepID=A0ABM3MFZ3_GALME|nr:uncharacterized protein LOC113511460 [Galleria mellonella]
MQADYQKKLPIPYWDTLHINYPVKKFPNTEESRETTAHQWKVQPEILKFGREPIEEIKEYFRNYNITKGYTKSQTSKDYQHKEPESVRFNKHTSCIENEYIYPLSRKIEDRPPLRSAHATTEMRRSYTLPKIAPRLITDKDQYKHPACMPEALMPEPSWHKELEPLDTTHDGYEKYLDPYLTTSRLHHRPYTADQLSRLSASKDVVTYYTLGDTTWTRTPKPKIEDWRLPLRRPKSMYDREKFKEDFSEIRTHNQLEWVPRTFRTEVRDNYVPQSLNIENLDEQVRTYYKRRIAKLPTRVQHEQTTIQDAYKTEYTQIGSDKPICSIFDPYIERNKRLQAKIDVNEVEVLT